MGPAHSPGSHHSQEPGGVTKPLWVYIPWLSHRNKNSHQEHCMERHMNRPDQATGHHFEFIVKDSNSLVSSK